MNNAQLAQKAASSPLRTPNEYKAALTQLQQRMVDENVDYQSDSLYQLSLSILNCQAEHWDKIVHLHK